VIKLRQQDILSIQFQLPAIYQMAVKFDLQRNNFSCLCTELFLEHLSRLACVQNIIKAAYCVSVLLGKKKTETQKQRKELFLHYRSCPLFLFDTEDLKHMDANRERFLNLTRGIPFHSCIAVIQSVVEPDQLKITM
jgi:hypothetical protein